MLGELPQVDMSRVLIAQGGFGAEGKRRVLTYWGRRACRDVIVSYTVCDSYSQKGENKLRVRQNEGIVWPT